MLPQIIGNGYRAARSPPKIAKYIQRKLYEKAFGNVYSPILTRKDIKSHQNIKYYMYDKNEKHTISIQNSDCEDVIINGVNRWSDYLPNNRFDTDTSRKNNKHSYTVHNHAPFVAVVKDAIVYSPYGIVKNRDNEFLIEIRGSSIPWAKDLFARSLQDWGIIQTLYVTKKSKKSKTEQIDVAATMLNARSVPDRMAYGHWLLEAIPRLRGIIKYSEKNGRFPKIYVDPHMAGWQRDLLLASGIKEEDLVTWDCGPTCVKEFIIPKWGKNEYCESDLRWVCENIKSNIEYEQYKDKFSNYIYLTRENCNNRKVTNRKEVMSLLKKYGFEKHDPSKMSIQEQVALFEQGDIFIGPNGSAFANMIFSQNATTIQIFPPDFFKMRLYEVNCILGHQAYVLLGQKKTSGFGHNANFTVSTNKIRSLLEDIL